jgi:hypothetical protein
MEVYRRKMVSKSLFTDDAKFISENWFAGDIGFVSEN